MPNGRRSLRCGQAAVRPRRLTQEPSHADQRRAPCADLEHGGASAGGSDEDWNLVNLCAPCHAMLHAGHAVILGRAPDELTFLLGTRREAYAGERRSSAGRAAEGVA
jgi:hypothetical protein